MIIDIYNILFEENFTPSVFFLIFFLLIAETYLLVRVKKEGKISNAVIIGITAFGLFFSMALIARPNEITERYEKWYSPGFNGSGCMSEALKNEDPSGDYYYNSVTFDHYFEGKDIVICSDISSKDEIAAYLGVFSSAREIRFSDDYSSNISQDMISEIEKGTQYIKKDSRKYILDKTWKKSERIIGSSVGETVYFMSEELYNDAITNNCDKDFLGEEELDLSATEYMGYQRGERPINQIILLMIFYMIGYIPSRILFKGKMQVLCGFISFPVGLSIVTVLGLLLMIFGIPFRRSILLATFAIVLAIEVYFTLKNKDNFDLKSVAKALLSAALLDVIIVRLKLFKFCTDSAHKMWCAYILAEGKAEKGNLFATCLPRGMLEPIIHAIGWKFKSDIVYGIYIGTFICSIGIIVSASYYLAKIENKSAVVALAIICAGIYASNNDAFIIGIWAHSNGPTGCMLLSMLVVIYVSLEKEIPTKWLSTLLGFTIVVTRVEGGIYVSLLLLLLCGLKNGKKTFFLNLVIAMEIILWQIINIIIVTGHVAENKEEFWTPQKGLILIGLSIGTIVFSFLMKTDYKYIKCIRSHYYIISIIVAMLLAIGMIVIRNDVAYSTGCVFIKHFATSNISNSGALWGFSLIMLPLMLASEKKKSRFLISLVIDYIILQFLIYCVRDQSDPIHLLIGDSCRRTLQQILSTSMLIIPLIWNELFDGKRKIIEGK